MREVWSKSSVPDGATDRMAIDTGGSFENQFASRRGWTALRGLLLLLHPSVKILTRVHIDAEQHLRVLGAAVLGTLPEVQSGAFRLNPHRVHLVGDEIRLARKTGHPEAMHNVRRAQFEEGRQ